MVGESLQQVVNRRALYIGLGLFAFAFLFRLIGIGWGLPNELHYYSYHPDEFLIFLQSNQIDIVHGKLTPGFYNYGTLYLTVLKVMHDMISVYSGAPDPQVVGSAFAFSGKVQLAGRIISALSGAGIVSLVWGTMRRWTTEIGAISGALLIAVAPAAVMHSRFQTVDMLAAFLAALSLYFALRLIGNVETGNTRLIALSALFAGLSGGTKYTGILAILGLVCILILTRRKTLLKDVGWLLLCPLGFLIGTPGALLDREKFVRDFTFEMSHTHTGHGTEFMSTSPGFLYHFASLFVGIGLIGTLLGGAGLVGAAVKRHVWAFALLSFAIPYYILIGQGEVKFLRYTFPLYFVIGCGFAWLVGACHAKGGWWRLASGLGLIGLLGLDNGGLQGSLTATSHMSGEEPRDAAAKYLTSVGAGKTAGIVKDPWFYSPPYYPMTGQLRGRGLYDRHLASTHDPHVVRFGREGSHIDWDPRTLTELKPDFVVFSNLESKDALRFEKVGAFEDGAKLELDRYHAFRQALEGGYERDKVFGEQPSGSVAPDFLYVYPVIEVWKRKSP